MSRSIAVLSIGTRLGFAGAVRRLDSAGAAVAVVAALGEAAGADAALGAAAAVDGALGAGGGGATGSVASDGGEPGPVEAHADRAITAASRHESSALPRRIAGNMALLIEDVPAVSPVPAAVSSVSELFAARF